MDSSKASYAIRFTFYVTYTDNIFHFMQSLWQEIFAANFCQVVKVKYWNISKEFWVVIKLLKKTQNETDAIACENVE